MGWVVAICEPDSLTHVLFEQEISVLDALRVGLEVFLNFLVAQLLKDSWRHVGRKHVPQVFKDDLVVEVCRLERLLGESEENVPLQRVE